MVINVLNGFLERIKLNITLKSLIWWGSVLLSFAVYLILTACIGGMVDAQLSQSVAKRWSKEGGASQISAFFSPKAQVDVDRILTFEHDLDSKLLSESISVESENPGARLWADAYSADGQITIHSDYGKVTVDALGIGGDFFLFHPLTLLSGTYFSGSDLMQDHILLDEEAAWQLFGSYDIAGMTVTINGVSHIVNGVVKRETGRFAKAAGLDASLVYVSYETLDAFGTHSGINHYEIVMPEPVSGFAFSHVKDGLSVDEREVVLVENGIRYSLLNRLRRLSGFGTRSMNGKAVIYPYWENIARGYEDVASLLTLFQALFLGYVVVFVVIRGILYWKRKTWTVSGLVRSLRLRMEDGIEKLRQKRMAHKEIM